MTCWNINMSTSYSQSVIGLIKRCPTNQLVAVPVESRPLQHKPVFLPFDTQEAFALFLPVQPALVVWLTKLFDRDPSSAHYTIAYTQKTDRHKCTKTSRHLSTVKRFIAEAAEVNILKLTNSAFPFNLK